MGETRSRSKKEENEFMYFIRKQKWRYKANFYRFFLLYFETFKMWISNV